MWDTRTSPANAHSQPTQIPTITSTLFLHRSSPHVDTLAHMILHLNADASKSDGEINFQNHSLKDLSRRVAMFVSTAFHFLVAPPLSFDAYVARLKAASF